MTRADARYHKRESGTCYDCTRPAAAGRRRCARHLEKGIQACARYLSSEHGMRNRRAHATANKLQAREAQKKCRRTYGRFEYVRKNAGRRKGRSWTLTREQFYTLVAMPCHYCGLPNNVEAGVGLDRLDNMRGYEPDNVVSCCKECNLVRGDRFTPEEMRVIGASVREVKLRREEAAA